MTDFSSGLTVLTISISIDCLLVIRSDVDEMTYPRHRAFSVYPNVFPQYQMQDSDSSKDHPKTNNFRRYSFLNQH